jgi:hypothetical protein
MKRLLAKDPLTRVIAGVAAIALIVLIAFR